jgi:hypothetical protein
MSTCPPWCTTDHEKPVYQDGRGIWVHMSAKTVIEPAGLVARIAVYLSSGYQLPAVNIHAMKYGDPVIDGFLVPDGPEALAVAVLVEVLADATPEQHRQVADAIRQAAGQLEPEAEA